MNEEHNHPVFQELCALATTGTLTAAERVELRRHLEVCPECTEAYAQYLVLTCEGLPLLASAHADPVEVKSWNEKSTWKRLLVRVRDAEQLAHTPGRNFRAVRRAPWAGLLTRSWARTAVAAWVVAGVGYGAYRVGAHRALLHDWATGSPSAQPVSSTSEETYAKRLVSAQAEKISRLEAENSSRQAQIEHLNAEWANLERRTLKLASTREQSESTVQSLAAERNTLAAQLAALQQSYADARKELAAVKSERDKALLQMASLESNLQDLKAAHQEQGQRLHDDEQYLASDRDIRELMGARKLYIADVFDVDSSSRTRKPYGRVFYTENKSLIFYAFDLDREPRVKNAAFQVWGEKDAPQGEKAHPLNLGILYMDSESNRRWVLRSDDSRQLAEIDAVFVTVEPDGGSSKPTSKPFLYALLRKEANHP